MTYRIRVGLYNTNCKTNYLFSKISYITYMLGHGLIAWIALLLLLSGDVEPNPGPNIINGFLLNTRSIKSVNSRRNKLAEFQSLVSIKNAMVICLTETWLTADVRDDEILPTDSYNIYRKDRDGHGGVLTAVHTSINSKHRPDWVSDNDSHNEIIAVEIRIPKLPKLALITFYRPPSDNSHECVANLEDTINKVKRSGFNNICLMGDFNLPNMDPVTGMPLDNRWNCEAFYNMFQSVGLSHLVTGPTHELGNTLDFILVTCPEYFTNINTEEELFPSDHFVINFGLVGDLRKSSKISRTVYNYRKADWQGLKSAIRNSNFVDIINRCGHNIDDACNLWTDKLIELINQFIPSYKIKNINSPPWIDGDVIHLSNKKETAHRKALRQDTTEAWSRYKVLRNRLKNLVNNKYNSFIKESSQDISANPKRFWSLLRAKTKAKNIPEKVYFDTSYAHTPIRKAFLFNRFFQANFTAPGEMSDLPLINEIVNHNLESCEISIAETRLIIDNIDVNKASGPDNISGRILKQCSR